MLKQIRRFLKITGISILVSIGLLIISMILLQFVFYNQVADRLKQVIEGNEDITILVGDVNYNVFTGDVSLTQVIARDTSGFFSISCDSMQIKGINPIPLIFKQQLNIQQLLLVNGNIEIHQDKKKPTLKNGKSRWIAEKGTIKNFHIIIINNHQSAARFKLKTFQAKKINSGSSQLLPINSADAIISDILIIREDNFFSLDSVYVQLKEGLSSVQFNKVDILSFTQFFGKRNDTVISPVKEFLVDKIQIGVPVYYFKYLTVKKIPTIELPFLRADGLQVHFQKHSEAGETKSSAALKSIPFDFNVNELKIQNGKIKVSQDSLIRLDFQLKHLKARNLRLDTAYKTYPVIADAVDVSLNNIYYGFDDQLYQLSIDQLIYTTGKNRIQADNLKIESPLDAEAYFKQKKFQTDMPSLAISAIMFEGLDISSFLNKNQFVFRKVWADTLELKMTRDKNYPYDLKKFPPMIQDQILKLPFIFSVDTVSIHHGDITYYEIPQGSTLEDAGMFQFTSASLNMYQCTNDTNKLQHNDTLMIHFRGKLYGQGVLNVFVDIPLLSKSYWHRVYGTIGKFNAREFNRITVPAVGVKLKGTVNGGEFYFEANNEASTGNVELLFEKLKVSVLTQPGNAAKSQTDLLKSLVANVFMVHDNPEPGKEVMVGKVYFKRNKNRWMINFWWKSLLQGVRSIVFAKEVQLREMSASFNEYKKLRKQREEMDQLMQE